MEGGDQLLPFARLLQRKLGVVNHVQQGEGGEQGELMPMLFALGQHSALVAILERLQEGELLFAFHDDLYVKSSHRQSNVPTFSVKSLFH